MGCPHDLDNSNGEMGAKTLNDVINGKQCKDCKGDFMKYWNENEMVLENKCQADGTCSLSGTCTDGKCPQWTLYDKCKKSGCNLECCKSLGCWACKYADKTGKKAPNLSMIYQKNRNNPQGMMSDLENYTGLDNNSKDIVKNDRNIWPMFSNEISHKWKDSGGGADGTGNSIDGKGIDVTNTCTERKYGGDTCGTFDGFGNWSWDSFETFLKSYANKYGLKQLGIYEWQFVSPEWKGRKKK